MASAGFLGVLGAEALAQSHTPARLSHVDRWCPSCFEGTRLVAAVEDLLDYLAVLGAFYQSEEFLVSTSLDLPGGAPPEFTEPMRRAIAADPYLRAMLGQRVGLRPLAPSPSP